MEEITDEILWEYIDGTLSKERHSDITSQLIADQALKVRLKRLADFQFIMSASVVIDTPAPRTLKAAVLDRITENVVVKQSSATAPDTRILFRMLTLFFLIFTLLVCISFAHISLNRPGINDAFILVAASFCFIIASYAFLQKLLYMKSINKDFEMTSA